MAKRGPRTKAGKAAVSLNAVTHGLRSSSPLILGLERPEDWEAHRDGLTESLAPVGALEEQLAGLVAGLLWRLRRVPAYEADQIAISMERIDDADVGILGEPPPSELRAEVARHQRAARLLAALPDMPANARLSREDVDTVLLAVADDDMSSFPKVVPGSDPPCALDDVQEWDAGLLRECVEDVAANLGPPAGELIAWAGARARERVAETRAELDGALREADRKRRDRALPDARMLERVTRYEAHLYRRLFQALHELEALQARRRGEAAPLARLQVHGLPGS